MATLSAAVELPTGRESMVDFPLTASIHDTNWNVLLNNGKFAKRDSKSSSTPDQAAKSNVHKSSRPSSRGQLSTSVRPSPARETPPQELDAGPVSYFPPRSTSSPALTTVKDRSKKQEKKESHSEQGHATQTSDDYTGSTRSASTAGTNSVQESQVYTLPENDTHKEEPATSPVILPSRSATSSTKRSVVPTSKYKKKPPSAVKASLSRRSGIETPLDSPMSGYTQLIQSPILAEMQAPMPTELPSSYNVTSTIAPPADSQTKPGQLSLQHTKSTASVRKARALHSHPSMPALRPGDPITSPMLPEPSPQTAALRSRKSIDAPRGRPSLVDMHQPTPAPNTPLPELPKGARPVSRPGSSHVVAAPPQAPPDAYVRPGTSASSVAPTLRRQDVNSQSHAEMANFMTSTSKIIFRRFHDVHVRLLLNLQDEIQALEKELADIESDEENLDHEREARRFRILSELRKLLAEYDHLFSNWNLMQGSKADDQTRRQLERWLQRSGEDSDTVVSEGAQEDLRWMRQFDDDLSSVDLNAKKPSPLSPRKETPKAEEKPEQVQKDEPAPPPAPGGNDMDTTTGGSIGGFAALFMSCAGKRK